MDSFFNLKTGKRYYHVLALKFASSFSTHSYWRHCGISKKSKKHTVHDTSDFAIEQESFISNVAYFGGEEEDYSVNGDGKPPYAYDLFVVQLKKLNVFVVGFPFKYLAKTLIEKLSDKKSGVPFEFMLPNLDKLIRIYSDDDVNDKVFSSHFSGVELRLSGETNLNTVNLDGDRPLDSSIYRNVFMNMVDSNECNVQKCTIKCEITTNDSSTIPLTRSNIHLDGFGNFKLYIHGSGNNIFTIPYLIQLFRKNKCLDVSLNNPLNKIPDE